MSSNDAKRLRTGEAIQYLQSAVKANFNYHMEEKDVLLLSEVMENLDNLTDCSTLK